jgi:hypothetical protein
MLKKVVVPFGSSALGKLGGEAKQEFADYDIHNPRRALPTTLR